MMIVSSGQMKATTNAKKYPPNRSNLALLSLTSSLGAAGFTFVIAMSKIWKEKTHNIKDMTYNASDSVSAGAFPTNAVVNGIKVIKNSHTPFAKNTLPSMTSAFSNAL